jgi:flavin reductase (DIM6/NTAB) family NADH-FMN oxidoreductase RutF
MTTISAGPGVASWQRTLRGVLGRYATGVTVMTTTHRGDEVGLTVNSFTSVSLDPPLVLWCLHRNSTCRPAFATAEHFAVNVLAATQQRLAAQFAKPESRFACVPRHRDHYQLPVLEDTVATLLCRRERLIPAGDHVVLLGAVLDYRSRPGPPLLFLDSAFHGDAPA